VIDEDLSAMIPPKDMWAWVGSPDRFVETGRGFFDYMRDKGLFDDSSAVLDVGCGVGKHAIHFARLLRPPGCYEGFDVEPRGIDWCRTAISPRYPHARFQHVDVHSGMYSPAAERSPSQLRFPYDDDRFDLVFLASVFSHMFFDDMAHYVGEIARVLKPGGRMIASGYYLGPYKRAGIAAGTACFTFGIEHRGSRIERVDPPEAAVAHDRPKMRAMFAERGLSIEEFRNGRWHDRGIQDQDFVLARAAK
jgi:SAM-dependent methyltransferase